MPYRLWVTSPKKQIPGAPSSTQMVCAQMSNRIPKSHNRLPPKNLKDLQGSSPSRQGVTTVGPTLPVSPSIARVCDIGRECRQQRPQCPHLTRIGCGTHYKRSKNCQRSLTGDHVTPYHEGCLHAVVQMLESHSNAAEKLALGGHYICLSH